MIDPAYNTLKQQIQNSSEYKLLSSSNFRISRVALLYIDNDTQPHTQSRQEIPTLTAKSLDHLQKRIQKKGFECKVKPLENYEDGYESGERKTRHKMQVSVPNETSDPSDCASEESDGWDKSFTPSSVTEVFQSRHKVLIPYATVALRQKAIENPTSLPKDLQIDSLYHDFDAIKGACNCLSTEGFTISLDKHRIQVTEIPDKYKDDEWSLVAHGRNP
ncbi:MAG: hypothetical protein V4489_05715 [Chlamydiota bacterium]